MQRMGIIGFLKEQNNNINHNLGERVNRGNKKVRAERELFLEELGEIFHRFVIIVASCLCGPRLTAHHLVGHEHVLRAHLFAVVERFYVRIDLFISLGTWGRGGRHTCW